MAEVIFHLLLDLEILTKNPEIRYNIIKPRTLDFALYLFWVHKIKPSESGIPDAMHGPEPRATFTLGSPNQNKGARFVPEIICRTPEFESHKQ